MASPPRRPQCARPLHSPWVSLPNLPSRILIVYGHRSHGHRHLRPPRRPPLWPPLPLPPRDPRHHRLQGPRRRPHGLSLRQARLLLPQHLRTSPFSLSLACSAHVPQGSIGQILDLLAYDGYKFVGCVLVLRLCMSPADGRTHSVIITLIAGLLGFGRSLYIAVFTYSFFATAFFLVSYSIIALLSLLNRAILFVPSCAPSARWSSRTHQRQSRPSPQPRARGVSRASSWARSRRSCIWAC